MDTKTLLIGAGVLLLGGGVWYMTHKTRRETRQANNVTQDANDPAVKLAKEWYSALNVTPPLIMGGNYSAGWTVYVSQAEINRIYNVALKTYNVKKVQNSFSALAGNTLSFNTALTQALGSKEPEAYKNANNYIAMKKVVTTAATKIYLCKKDGTLAKVGSTLSSANIAKNECVGAFIDEKKLTVNGKAEQYYIALRSMENGTPAYFAVLKSSCKLM